MKQRIIFSSAKNSYSFLKTEPGHFSLNLKINFLSSDETFDFSYVDLEKENLSDFILYLYKSQASFSFYLVLGNISNLNSLEKNIAEFLTKLSDIEPSRTYSLRFISKKDHNDKIEQTIKNIFSKNSYRHSYTSDNSFYILKNKDSFFLLSSIIDGRSAKRYYNLYSSNRPIRPDLAALLVLKALAFAKNKEKIFIPFMNDGNLALEAAHLVLKIPIREKQKQLFKSPMLKTAINKISRNQEIVLPQKNREPEKSPKIYALEKMPEYLKAKKNIKLDGLEDLIFYSDKSILDNKFSSKLRPKFFDMTISLLPEKIINLKTQKDLSIIVKENKRFSDLLSELARTASENAIIALALQMGQKEIDIAIKPGTKILPNLKIADSKKIMQGKNHFLFLFFTNSIENI